MTQAAPSQTALVRRARRINRELARLYPDARIELDFTSPLELLVAAILAAQSTDRSTNEVTRVLFTRYRTAADYAAAERAELEAVIHPTGYFRAKANTLISLGQALCDRFGDEIPGTLGKLVMLPGVGRKTANMVLGDALRHAGPHGGHPFCPAGTAVWLDGLHRPRQDRARCCRAPAAPGVDCGLAPANLARPSGLPRAHPRLRRMRDRPAMPFVRPGANR